jgi:glycosyltransferase involved in cell wall biosynthesis
MNILSVTSHCGGGVGSVLLDWIAKDTQNSHSIACLDYANQKAKESGAFIVSCLGSPEGHNQVRHMMREADIVVLHWWDHPLLYDLISQPLPDCRMVAWAHKNTAYPPAEIAYPDLWVDTSPVQGHGRYIWSCGDISRFLAIQPKEHSGFNIGTVVSMKMDIKGTLNLFMKIGELIPEAYFTWIGDFTPMNMFDYHNIQFLGKVPDIAPYLSEMDLFAYPLKPDHYGTCEQVLGEAMAAGVVPVVMDNPAERLIIQDSESGLLARDEANYIHCMKYLHNLPSERYLMADKARIHAKSVYNIDNMIQQWNDVFDEMMKQPKRPHGGLK